RCSQPFLLAALCIMLPSHNSGANGEDTFTAAVFLDTFSRVGEFVPPALYDHQLNSCICRLTTKEGRLISLGRPLWKTIYDSATAPQ
ncbi:8716_t:CDS:2, partial [Paraglomus occultum]